MQGTSKYLPLKHLIEAAKTELLFLRQPEIDRIFSSNKPHEITKLSMRVARHLDFHRQYDLSTKILNTAKSLLRDELYHNYLIHKSYCIDKLITCEKELYENRAFHTVAAASRQKNIQQPQPAATQPKSTGEENISTLMMNNAMMTLMMNQTVQNVDDHCQDASDNHHHHSQNHHHTHHDDPNNGLTLPSSPPNAHDTNSNDYSSHSVTAHTPTHHDYASSVQHDNSSIYHNSGSLFDHGSSHHDYSSSSHDHSSSTSHDYSSSSHDYSSSSHDTSSHDHSNSYSM